MIDAYVKGFSNFVYIVYRNFRVFHQHDCWSLMKANQVHHHQMISCFNSHQLWYEGGLIKAHNYHLSPSLPYICVESIGFIPLIFIEPHLSKVELKSTFRPFDSSQIQLQQILIFYVIIHLKEVIIVIIATSSIVTNRTLFCNFLKFNIFF
jgi:hypothetical protein